MVVVAVTAVVAAADGAIFTTGAFSNRDGFTSARRAPGIIIANVASSASGVRAFKIFSARVTSSSPAPPTDVDRNSSRMSSTSNPTSFVDVALAWCPRSWINEYVNPCSFGVSDGVLALPRAMD
jgi:hypothetical protein